jgi:YbbR domain-containing protein
MSRREGGAGRRGLRRIFEAVRDALLHNFGLKVLSIVLAFALWFFVNAGERDTEAGFQVPLELRNIPADLMIVSPRVDFVDLRVSGPRTLLSRIDREKLSMILDLEGVRAGPAVFRVVTDALNLPRGVRVVRLTPAEVTLELARVVRRKVPVRVALSGKPPGDLRVTDVKVAPEVVEVIGPADEVNEFKVAETLPLELTEASAGLIEREIGLEPPREYLSLSASLVHAQVLLEEPEKSRTFLDVSVVVRQGTYRSMVEPSKVRITVRGPQSPIESLELSHGAVYIDATGLEPGTHKVMPSVDLPPEVELVKVQPETLRLKVLDEERKVPEAESREEPRASQMEQPGQLFESQGKPTEQPVEGPIDAR